MVLARPPLVAAVITSTFIAGTVTTLIVLSARFGSGPELAAALICSPVFARFLAVSISVPPLRAAFAAPRNFRTHGSAVRRRVLALVRFRAELLFPARPNFLLVVIPLRLFRVFILLSRIAVLTTRSPFRIAARPLAAAIARAFALPLRTRAFPPTFALAKSLRACRLARLKKLTTFEPLQLRVGVFLAKAIEGGQ
jgi:hypothetical protein